MAPKQDLPVAAGRVVALYYKVGDDEGREIDSHARHGSKPMVFLVGSGKVVPGLEKLIEGKRKNDFVRGTVPPEEAYGPHRPELVEVVDRKAVPLQHDLRVGMMLAGTDTLGNRKAAVVTAIEDDRVTLDKNHPLAGKALHFEVTVAGVREATPEETAHGHVHGPGGHKH